MKLSMAQELKLEQFLPYRLSLLSNTISAGIADTYRDQHQLSVTEWRTIAILGRFPDLSANQVAHKGAFDKVAVSRAVSRLLERQLLTRHTDPTDRRRSVLALSKAGHELHQKIAPAAIEQEQRLLAGLNTEEQKEFNRLIDKLFAHLAKENH